MARALALESDVLLLDEPFAAIDPKLRQELQELVSSLCAKQKKTVVFVTHDIDEAILLGDRIIVMEPGRIRTEVKVGMFRGGSVRPVCRASPDGCTQLKAALS